jgi:hypothetical protein
LSDGSDTDLSEEAQTLDMGEDAIVDAVGGDVDAVGGDVDVDAEGRSKQLDELRAYDQLIALAKKMIRNPRTAHLLTVHRKEHERSLRGVDNDVLKAMEEERSQSLNELAEKRAVLREVENERIAQKKIDDAAKKEKDAAQKEKKALNDKLKHDAMLVDRAWEPEDFGSLPKDTKDFAEKLKTCHLTAQHRKNIRECFMRTPIA